MTDIVVLGLDGATWDVLDPLIQQGRLPALQGAIDQGQAGELESTFPPITAPAWLSMATSQNPGKTGVFYFLNRNNPDSFDFQSVGSDKFQSKSFWDVLTAQGYDVGVFNFPMLYPPYNLGENGFMVSGLGSPEDDTITYPTDLKSELDEVTDGYEVKVPYADPKYHNRPGKLEGDLHEIVDKREQAIEFLLTEKCPDVFFGVISATDWAQHYFWRYHDSSHALYGPDLEGGHEDAINRLWERVDETVGLVADIAEEEDATLVLVSDHGFGPVNRAFYSNTWLESKGFQVEKDQPFLQQLRTDYFPYLRRVGEAVVSRFPPLNDIATKLGRQVRGSPEETIDWDRSIAFAPKQNFTCGMLYLLSDDPDDERTVVEGLESLTDTNGDPLSVNVYRPSDLYHGPRTDLAPDILFEIEDFECGVDPRPKADDEIFVDGPPSVPRSGGHRMEGIYVVAGNGVQSGDGIYRPLLDIAPTILWAMNSPIPEEMDGEVMTDAFKESFRDTRDVDRFPLSELVERQSSTGDRDTDAVQERLEDLGYI